MQFKVRYKFELAGEIHEGIESEASWYLIDQRGKFYSYGPISPIRPCEDKYLEIEPLIKIHDEYLTIKEIEKRLEDKCK